MKTGSVASMNPGSTSSMNTGSMSSMHTGSVSNGEHDKHTTSAKAALPPRNSVPPISVIADVTDKQFDVTNSGAHETLWIKHEPEWTLDPEQTTDPRMAYIYSNFRAGLEEQKHKTSANWLEKHDMASNCTHEAKIPAKRGRKRRSMTDSANAIVITAEARDDVTNAAVSINNQLSTYHGSDPPLRQIPSPEKLSQQVQSTMTSCDNQKTLMSRFDIKAEVGTKSIAVQCEIISPNHLQPRVSPPASDSAKAATTRDDCVIIRSSSEFGPGAKMSDDAYVCVYCNIDFHDAVLFSIHMGCHRLDEPFCCNICGTKCCDKYAFYTHIMRGHHNH